MHVEIMKILESMQGAEGKSPTTRRHFPDLFSSVTRSDRDDASVAEKERLLAETLFPCSDRHNPDCKFREESKVHLQMHPVHTPDQVIPDSSVHTYTNEAVIEGGSENVHSYTNVDLAPSASTLSIPDSSCLDNARNEERSRGQSLLLDSNVKLVVDLPPMCQCQKDLSPVTGPTHLSPTKCTKDQGHQTVMPSAISRKQSVNQCSDSHNDLLVLSQAKSQLKQSGFYYENLSMEEAKKKLRRSKEGTYLLRDSADPQSVYSISVQTARGATSVRIKYENGFFRLDCEEDLLEDVPMFKTIIDLIDYYVRGSVDSVNSNNVWLEKTGRRDTPMVLREPLLRKHSRAS